ncbi:ABC transporter permease [Streptobacillus felis]|uniref:FtsX-like permease family protein n=1 Tax=Streptobacillus felis TaxID=1384509 RepID=UPI0039E9E03F
MKTNNKDIIREFFKSKTRFLAIFIINLLGISTFIGLNVLNKDMYNTINNLYQEFNVADIKVSSNIALNKDDLEILNNLEYISEIEYGYNDEIFIENTKKLMSLKNIPENISKIKVMEGKLPENRDEIIIEYKLKYTYPLNFKINNFKVVGYFENVENRFLNSKNPAFSGYGAVDVEAYVDVSYFENKDYNFDNIKLNTDLPTYDKKYNEYVFEKKIDLENAIYKNAQNKLKEFLKDNYSLISNAEKKIFESKNEIENNQKKILSAKEKIEIVEKNLQEKFNQFEGANEKFQYNEDKINKQKVELIEKHYDLKEKLVKLEEGLKELETNEIKIKEGYSKIEDGLEIIKENENKINESKKEVLESKINVDNLKPNLFFSSSKIEDAKNKINAALKEIQNGEDKLNLEKEIILQNKKELDENLNYITNKKEELLKNKSDLINGLKSIELGIDKIESGYNKLIEEKNKYNKEYTKNLNKLNIGKKEIEKNKNEIIDAEKKFNTEKIKAFDKLNESIKEVEVNKRKLSELNAIYFVNTRIDNPSYSSYIESVESLNVISKIFPLIFYLIVVLVSTTTMTRMVDEQRNSIGTYMFLGYSKKVISKKYYIYALIPTILGILFGIYFGTYFIPKYIYTAFKAGSISSFDKLFIILDKKIIIISVFASILSTFLSVFLSLRSDFNHVIADLLKPKVPKNGTKILLEKIKFLWNNLSFSNKISLRNIFRYKGKMIMNLLGVAGCTSLIFLGFAIKNSFSEISELQYNKIRNFHSEINLKNHLNEVEINDIINLVSKNFENIPLQSINGKFLTKKRENRIKIYIIDKINIDKYFYLSSDLDSNGALISSRALSLLDKKIGESILVKDYIGNEYNFNISNVIDNYQGNYIFITKDYYEKKFNKKYKINNLVVKNSDKDMDYILNNDEIQSITLNKEYKLVFDKISESLNFIVIFITVLSAMLSIVVTYSLLEINVNERQRELATIKVIGFYPSEVSLYIYKEILALTFVGIFIGLILGKGLHKIILYSMKKTNTVFVENIGYSPYIYSIFLTLLFSIISMLLIHRKLKNINMIEALKME